tara:strand:- start:422 stop:712 length:291 start_codon:yes stop_codon:yes gene_type:complete
MNVVLALLITVQAAFFVYMVLTPDQKAEEPVPTSAIILYETPRGREVFEMDRAFVEQFGDCTRVTTENETYLFDSSKIVVVKNPTKALKKRLLEKE